MEELSRAIEGLTSSLQRGQVKSSPASADNSSVTTDVKTNDSAEALAKSLALTTALAERLLSQTQPAEEAKSQLAGPAPSTAVGEQGDGSRLKELDQDPVSKQVSQAVDEVSNLSGWQPPSETEPQRPVTPLEVCLCLKLAEC